MRRLIAGMIMVGVAVVGVSCGNGGDEASPTPPPTETPRPTVEPYKSLTPHPTPAPVVGVPAHEGGRTDCLADWYAYNDADGHFSLCFPTDLGGRVSVAPNSGFGTGLDLDLSDGGHLSIYWKEHGSVVQGLLESQCDVVSQWRDVEEITLALGDRSVPGCAGDATDYGHPNPGGSTPLRGTYAEIALAPGDGFIDLRVIEVGDATSTGQEPLSEVLGSILLER